MSTAGVWVIVVVATLALAFWLVMIFVADRSQVRASGPGLASRGAWVGGSMVGGLAGEFPAEAVHEPATTRTGDAGDEPAPPGEMPTRTDLPAQPATAGPDVMPRQRTGEADRAARSHAGPDQPDDEQPGR